jgi:hypothetical protein
MKRRTFIKGAVSVAVAASLPGGDGVELQSMAHPQYMHKTFRVGKEWTLNGKSITTFMVEDHEFTERMAAAIARSMAQTRERVAADVFNRAFGE